MVLNNGLAYMDCSDVPNIEQKVAFSQTFGPSVTFKNDVLKVNATTYFQFGKNGNNEDLSSRYFATDIAVKISDMFNIGIGFENLSGTNSKLQGKNDDRSFRRFYGTNHKFNGWMDCFYVGSHSGNVGLIDIFIPIKFRKDKFLVALIPLYFLSATKVTQMQDDGSWKGYDSGLAPSLT